MSTTLSIAPTRVILSAGKFDTNNRYIRAGSGYGNNFPIPKAETVYIQAGGGPPNHYVNWMWNDGYDASVSYNSGGTTASGTPGYTLVTL